MDTVLINITEVADSLVAINIIETNDVVNIIINENVAGDGSPITLEKFGEEFTGSTNNQLPLNYSNYVSGTIRLYKNGIRLSSSDFTEGFGNTITILVPRETYDVFTVDYKYI
jgi:hypothetical protein